jgi:hypothetical protein
MRQPAHSFSATDSVIVLVSLKGVMSKHRKQLAALFFSFALISAVNSAQTPAPVSGIDPALLARAKSGDAAAQFLVATAYRNGQGVPKDQALSASWQRQSAEQGFAKAQYNLGVCYFLGQGVPQDYEQAALWYQKAAAQGDPDALESLATLYAEGRGVEKNSKQAAVWYRKAADQGDPRAQYDLGVMYEYGNGVP